MCTLGTHAFAHSVQLSREVTRFVDFAVSSSNFLGHVNNYGAKRLEAQLLSEHHG